MSQVEPATGVPPRKSPNDFDDFLSERLQKSNGKGLNHPYSRASANKKYAKAKSVDRFFSENYDTFSTVLLSYVAQPKPDESISNHSKRFYPRALVRKRRRLLKKLEVWEECAGVSVLAPKHRTAEGRRVPPFNPPTSHAHTFLWIPGEVSEEDFRPLIETHIAKVEGATTEAHGPGAVSVEIHDSAEVRTPYSVKARGTDLDAEKGDTTALPQEVGANLPMLKCQYDARGAPAYIYEWCREIYGSRLRRFRPFAEFSDIADSMQAEGDRVPPFNPPTLSETEAAFVSEYVEEVGDPTEEVIVAAIEGNAGKFSYPIHVQELVRQVQERLA